MRSRWVLGALLLLCGRFCCHASDSPTEFVLVDQFLVADEKPDPHFSDTGATLSERFRSAFLTSFPSSVIQLGPARLLRPEEPAVIIIPRITAARISHEVVAGTIHDFEASITGSVAAVDPWSETTLFAATRMVSERVRLGSSALAATDADLRSAFHNAFNQWMQDCFAELNSKLSVFRLTAATLSLPNEAAKLPGGAWPFGSERGVRSGAILTGNRGHAARVVAAFDRYSDIEDAAETSRPMSLGEDYSLTVAQKPGQRREPRVAVLWSGAPPGAPAGTSADPLSVDAITAIFLDYLSKNSALRLLPAAIEDPIQQQKFRDLSLQMSRFTGLIPQELMDLSQEAAVQMARENPEFRIVLFAPGSYFGVSAGRDGSVERRFRATLGAALFARQGDEAAPIYGLVHFFLRNSHLGRVVSTGVRDADNRAAVFTIWRNAAIELAKEVLTSGGLKNPEVPLEVEGEIAPSHSPAWPSGLSPDTYTPLRWLRPSGIIQIPGAPAPSAFYRVQKPSLGYLTEAILSSEKLKSGDRLQYTREGKQPELLGLWFEIAPKDATALVDAALLERMVAGRVADTLDRDIIATNSSGQLPNGLDGLPILRCYVSGLTESDTSSGLAYSGQWRLQLLLNSTTPAIAKLGLQVTSQVPAAEVAGIQPIDQSAYRFLYFQKALDQLASSLRTEGFVQALNSHRSAP